MLRSYDLGEADRIITMLSRSHGKIRAVAKGVRRTKSRFGSRVEPFSMVDVQLYSGRNLDTITQVESRNHYGSALVNDYPSYLYAAAIVDIAERLTGDDPDPQQFKLLHGALHAIAAKTHPGQLVLASYVLRALAHSGWQLAIFECANCALPGPHSAFHLHSGGAVCSDCRPPGATQPTVATWQLLAALFEGQWDIAESASAATVRSASALIFSFAQFHLETNLASLQMARSAGEDHD